MEQKFIQGNDQGLEGSRSYVGASAMMAIGIFLDRFAYYGFRGLFILFLSRGVGLGDGESFSLYAINSGLVIAAAILSGWLVDAFLDKRIAMAVGAFCFSSGVVLFALGESLPVYWGLSLIATGQGLSKVAQFSYFGFLLDKRHSRMEAGFTWLWAALNLGAFLASIVLFRLGQQGSYALGFGVVSTIGLLQCILFLVGIGANVMPSETKWSSANSPAPLSRLGGLVFVPFMAATIWGGTVLMSKWSMSFGTQWAFVPLMLVLLLGAFLLMALYPRENRLRQNLTIIGCGSIVVFVYACMELATSALYSGPATEDQSIGMMMNLQGLFVAIAAVVMAVILILWQVKEGNGLRGLGTRILIGVFLSISGCLFYSFAPQFGGPIVGVGVILVVVGEVMFYPSLYATVWRTAPRHLKGTAMGFVSGAGYLSFSISEIFQSDSTGFIDGNGILLNFGLALTAILALVVAVGVWVVTRKLKLKLESEREFNPFE